MAKKKDRVEMICSVGELAGLFEKSSDLEHFLDTVVSIIAFHMKAAVCSVYLLDDNSGELMLRATQGLRPEAVGRVSMPVGEGLTGMAVKELRPIREGRGSLNPHYKYFPNIQEEQYEAFLAVPITHGLHRVGALVVQDSSPDYFSVHDEKALRAIAAQLASTIENAKLLIGLHDGMRGPRKQLSLVEPDTPGERVSFIKGRGVSSGAVCGPLIRIGGEANIFLDAAAFGGDYNADQFDRAMARSEEQLERLQNEMDEKMMDVASLIFSAQLLMLKDRKFSGSMRERIDGGEPVVSAVIAVINEYIALFDKSANARLREKVQDLKDVGLRILQNLEEPQQAVENYENHVLAGHDVLPSDIIKFTAQGAAGILMLGGAGVTAHSAILARSLEIPMVIVDARYSVQLEAGRCVLLDAAQGSVFVDPSDEVIEKYRPLFELTRRDRMEGPQVEDQTVTADGEEIKLLANINLISDLALANRYKAAGVGLYRSEFPFIIRSDFPTEEEQYPIYRRILDDMQGRPVVFRTLDIGGDKMLDYFPHRDEANPFLGLRAIRFSLRYKEIFCQQLRALLRAGHGYELQIMFPLIASVDDFEQARAVVWECLEQLRAEEVEHNPSPRLGVMIELPSVVEVVDELAREVDFMSIGSNDLIQYMLAVDRTNDQISELYMPYHPAVLRTVNRVAKAAERAGVPLSICGDMAREAKLTPFLVGIGIRCLSMDPHAIPGIQAALRNVTVAQCRRFSDQLLALGTIREVQELLARPAP
jgi:phosphotransferase system enzyme I (PtsP)